MLRQRRSLGTPARLWSNLYSWESSYLTINSASTLHIATGSSWWGRRSLFVVRITLNVPTLWEDKVQSECVKLRSHTYTHICSTHSQQRTLDQYTHSGPTAYLPYTTVGMRNAPSPSKRKWPIWLTECFKGPEKPHIQWEEVFTLLRIKQPGAWS